MIISQNLIIAPNRLYFKTAFVTYLIPNALPAKQSVSQLRLKENLTTKREWQKSLWGVLILVSLNNIEKSVIDTKFKICKIMG